MAAPVRLVSGWLRRAGAGAGAGAGALALREPGRASAAPLRPLASAAGERRAPPGPRALGGPGAPAGRASAARDPVASALLDMGFGDAHVDALLAARPGTPPQQLLGVASELLLLGLHPEPACVALTRSPALLALPLGPLRKRSDYLRKLGLAEGRLKRVLSCCPEVLSVPQRRLEELVAVLRDRCRFSAQQVTEILHRCPHLLQVGPEELEYRFQYGHFRMGLRHAEVVRSGFLQFPAAKVRQRHEFLERLGRYRSPRGGRTGAPNPPLADVLRAPEAQFLAATARASAAEFDVFKKLLAREEEEAAAAGLPSDARDGAAGHEEEDGEEPDAGPACGRLET